MEIRPIDAERLRDEIVSLNVILGGKLIFHPEARKSVLDAIEMSETLDYAPVVHGEWISAGNGVYYCSKCDSRIPFALGNRYCPKCGAKMEK